MNSPGIEGPGTTAEHDPSVRCPGRPAVVPRVPGDAPDRLAVRRPDMQVETITVVCGDRVEASVGRPGGIALGGGSRLEAKLAATATVGA